LAGASIVLNPLWYRLLLLLGAAILSSGAIATSVRSSRAASPLFQSFVGLYLIVALIFSGVIAAAAMLAP
jgi:hypothetical protein